MSNSRSSDYFSVRSRSLSGLMLEARGTKYRQMFVLLQQARLASRSRSSSRERARPALSLTGSESLRVSAAPPLASSTSPPGAGDPAELTEMISQFLQRTRPLLSAEEKEKEKEEEQDSPSHVRGTAHLACLSNPRTSTLSSPSGLGTSASRSPQQSRE